VPLGLGQLEAWGQMTPVSSRDGQRVSTTQRHGVSATGGHLSVSPVVLGDTTLETKNQCGFLSLKAEALFGKIFFPKVLTFAPECAIIRLWLRKRSKPPSQEKPRIGASRPLNSVYPNRRPFLLKVGAIFYKTLFSQNINSGAGPQVPEF
jgi:hypothetical protein